MTRPVGIHPGALALALSWLLLMPIPAAAGIADAPDDCASATPIATGLAWTAERLQSPGDVDWFSFTLAAESQVLATLGDLPVGASLGLYSSCDTHLATSARPGLEFEELLRELPPGTYRLQVAADPGVWSGRLYGLRARTLPAKMIILSFRGWTPYPATFPDRPRVVGEVLNATGSRREDVKIRIRFYDAADTLLTTSFTWARRERMRPRDRSMFEWYGEDVPGFDHARVTVARAPLATYPPLTGLVAHPGGTTPDGFGGTTYWGTLENTRAFSVGVPRIMVTVYDELGGVLNASFVDTEPDPMAPGASSPYEVHLDDPSTGNRVVVATHGYRSPALTTD